ncbi:MAG: site-specific DNA-methyltransferase [Thiobacillus sp.]|nr:site-specific DNA-methyltransferase [Thiobacillus sp.]
MKSDSLLSQLDHLNEQQLRRLLVEHLTKQKLGLYWEASAIERDAALNANLVLPRLVQDWSHTPPAGSEPVDAQAVHRNLIIEGDNFDALRLLRATHRGKIRVIYIDPPYNTGNKDWVYNDRFVGTNDRWRHSQWLEFLYRRLTLARDLLTPDGVILVSINDENRARLELLMDEVFPGMRLGSLVWRTKDTGNDLSQRFSHVHEHVLVYANAGFKFNGRVTDRSKFRNPDKDEHGDWSPQPLTKAHTYLERENTYYPIQDPDTGYWYPCDPNRVWAYASEQIIRKRLEGNESAIEDALKGLRSDTIEQLIKKKLIYFPPCKPSEVMQYENRDELLAAIKSGKGPILPKKKTPLLRADLPDLDFWIGKPIATGRPSRKEHWTAKPEEDRIAPLSSWIAGMNEDVAHLAEDEEDEPLVLRSARGGVATEEVKNIFGSKAFQHPKPLSLIKGLISQATRPTDIVLDFFAGSGTTGQAVLELNAEDGGQRRFILCSSTEATAKEPDKNLCRDVCAERMRRVITGYGGKAGYTLEQGGEFGYLQLDTVEVADAPFEIDAAHAFQLLTLKRLGTVGAASTDTLQRLGRVEDCELLVCHEIDADTLARLAAWPQQTGAARLAVYSSRPDTLREQLAARGVEANCYSLMDAIFAGQRGVA